MALLAVQCPSMCRFHSLALWVGILGYYKQPTGFILVHGISWDTRVSEHFSGARHLAGFLDVSPYLWILLRSATVFLKEVLQL